MSRRAAAPRSRASGSNMGLPGSLSRLSAKAAGTESPDASPTPHQSGLEPARTCLAKVEAMQRGLQAEEKDYTFSLKIIKVTEESGGNFFI